MVADRFDAAIPALTTASSRRRFALRLGVLLGATAAFDAGNPAGKKRKRRT